MKKENTNDAKNSVKMEPLEEDWAEADLSIRAEPLPWDNLETEDMEKAEDGSDASSSLISAATAGKLPAHSAGPSASEHFSSVSSAGALKKEAVMTSVTSGPKSVDKVAVDKGAVDKVAVGSELNRASLVRRLVELMKQGLIGSVSKGENCATFRLEDLLTINDIQTPENGQNQPWALFPKDDGTETPGREPSSDSTSSISTEQLNQQSKMDKPFSCHHCVYTTSRKHNLTKHLMIHQSNRDKPFGCDDCKYRTDFKDHLKRHLRIHQPERKKEFSCHICNYESDIKSYVRRHALTHQKILLACEHCEYRTHREAHLRQHLLTHESARDKPFACCNCTYKTDRKSSLRRHLLTHQRNRKEWSACD